MSNGDEGTGDSDEGDDDLYSMPEADVEITCPYCGEVVAITLDASGGATQEFVEDCQVCCRPCQVTVRYGLEGSVDVRVEAI